MKLGPVFVAVVLGGSLLVACGSDDSDEALSKSEFIAKGDAICSKSNAEFQKLFDTDFPTTQAAIPTFFDKAAASYRKQVNGLRELKEPEADKARMEKLLASGDRTLADFEKASMDAKFGATLFSEEGGKNSRAFEKQAKAYGFAKCEKDEEDERKPEVNPSSFSAEKKAYIKDADAICREGNAKFSALEKRYLKSFPPPLEGWGKFLPEIVKAGRAQTADLEKITPPEADTAKIKGLLTRQKEVIAQFEKAGVTAAAKDEEAFQTLSKKMFAAGDELDADLRAYGFQECGSEEQD